MKKTVLAWAFVAFAGAVGATASQAATDDRLFERLDADKSGDVSFEEFLAAITGRLENADKDADGKLTVGEISATLKGQKANKQAEALVARFDTDKDGSITLGDVEARRKQRFAELDADADGKLVKEEMRARASAKGDRPKPAAQ